MNSINNRELQEINKVIEVLTAYKEEKQQKFVLVDMVGLDAL